jgi:Dolichyl-phosphate-mannose-protein mannosyltransferase
VADWLICAVFCLLLGAAGWPWAALLAGRRPPPVARAALSYLIGVALVTLGLLFVAFVRIPVDRNALLAVIAAWWVAGTILTRRTRPLRSAPPSPAGRMTTAVPALAVAALGLGYILVEVFRNGTVHGTDFVSFWGKKGLALFLEHDLAFSRLDDAHTYYPLELSNLYGASHLMLGHVNDEVIKLPLALFPISLAVVAWWMCRLLVSPAIAAAAVALPVTAPFFAKSASIGSADLVVASYVTVAVLACFFWVDEDDPRWAALAGAAAGAASWTKVEGALTCGVLLVTVLILQRRLWVPGVGSWLAWFGVFVVPWAVFRKLHGIETSRQQFSETNFDLPWITMHVSEKLLARPSVWGAFWLVCLLVIACAAPLWWRTRWRTLAALVLPNLVLTMGAYVITYSAGSDGAVSVTASRLYLHLAPSVAVMTAVAAGLAWESSRLVIGQRPTGIGEGALARSTPAPS